MLFRKIVRSFCLRVIFSFLGLAAALAQDQEPSINTDSEAVLFTRTSPQPFKGINPPFTPPKDSISELLMDPKRTLVLMETDQATDTRFSLVKVVGGLPGGIPCVGGVNWPRGYEIVGEVPTDVDLTNDTIAKSLVNKGKAALFSFCPRASITETVTIWLFKSEIPTHQSYDYEVYASWETQLPAAPGPRIKAEYYNRALEHAKRLAESRVRKVAPTRQSSTSPDPFPTTSTKTVTSERDIGRYIVELIIGIVLVVVMLIFLGPLLLILLVFAFYFYLIIGPIWSIVILYTAYTTNTPLADNDKGILICTALTWIGFVIYLVVGRGRSGGAISESSGGGYSSYNYSKPDSDPEVNPIFSATKIGKAILSDDKILRGSSGEKVGRLEKAIFSNDQIIRDSSGAKAGRIEQSIWDSDKQIIKGADGEKEGEIKTDWLGRRVIVNADGEKIGRTEKNFWGNTVIKKD